jgi:hypothetical protein
MLCLFYFVNRYWLGSGLSLQEAEGHSFQNHRELESYGAVNQRNQDRCFLFLYSGH